MTNRLRLLTLTLLLVPFAARGQDTWTEVNAPVGLVFEGWMAPGAPIHGLVVDPSDRLWVCRFGAGPLDIYNADGSEASFSPIDTVAAAGTNTGNCRGINTDHEGNIIAVLQSTNLVRLNAGDGSYIDSWVGASSLTRPAVDQEGYVYVTTVVGADPVNPIHVLELPSYTEALTIEDDYTWWGRAVDVTDDGLRIAAGRIFGGIGAVIFESEDALEYAISDTLAGFEGDGSTVHFTSQDVLWATDEGANADDAELSTRNLKVFNFADNTYYVLRHDSLDIRPRGLGFSSDGKTVYVGSFTTGRVAKFSLGENTAVAGPAGLPEGFVLEANTPNPFSGATTLRYALKTASTVTLRVHDVTGRLVRTLVGGEMQAADSYRVAWNGLDDAGRAVSSGMYFYTLEAGGERQTRGMMLLK